MKTKKLKNRLSIYLLIAPFLILFIIFTVVPILSSVGLSFFYYDTVSTPKFIGLDNYIQMFFNDDMFPKALLNSVFFAVVIGPLSFMLCFLLAWLVCDYGKRTRTILSFLIYAPALSGNVYFIWKLLFSGDSYGYINSILLSIGLISEPIQWLQDSDYVLPIVVVVQLWMSFGTSFLANIAGIQSVDSQLYEAAAMDGVPTRWHEMWYVTLPSMKSILVFSCVMQIQSAFAISTVPKALAGFPSVNYSVETLVTLIGDVGTTRYELGYAAAISVFLFVLMLITKNVMLKFINFTGS